MKWNQKWKIPDTVLERQTLYFSSYKNRKLKVKHDNLELAKEKRSNFCTVYFVRREFF